jgi:hypothetical protein
VTIEVRSPALIERVRTVTEGSGQYRILALPVGTYEVRFSLPSFSTAQREGIIVTTGFTATVNADLTVGDISETVVVSGEAPTVDVQTARTVTTLTGEDIRDLPSSRNLSSLMVLVPGLTYQTGILSQAGGVCRRRGGHLVHTERPGLQRARSGERRGSRPGTAARGRDAAELGERHRHGQHVRLHCRRDQADKNDEHPVALPPHRES